MDPGQILPESWYDEYQRHKDILGRELVRLNATLYVLERVQAFPFHIFAPYGERSHFWDLTAMSLFETSILAIWKLGIDSKSGGLTLGQFKNKVMQQIQDEAIREQLRLETRDFSKRFSPLRGKVRDLRHNIVAHWNLDWLSADAVMRKERTVGVTHLQAAAQVLGDLFSTLCFKHKFATLPVDYLLERKNPWRLTDIDELLDDIARKSYALTQPEQDSEGWNKRRAEFLPHDLEAFNRYRIRCGLDAT